MNATSERRFYRDADRAMFGGVCAGIADHMGFNLKMTRCLTIIAFLMAMPVAVAAYLGAVFLTPSVSRLDNQEAFQRPVPLSRRERRRARKRQEAAARQPVASPRSSELINEKCSALDQRLMRLEKKITSRRFQLEQEFAKL